VSVERQREAQGVLVVHAHRAVQQTHRDQQAILRPAGAVPHAQHIMRQR
jgi:hypothetical protein